MKTIHEINKWSFIATLLLYLTFLYGLLAQIFLGGVQVILALIIFVYWKKLKTKQKQYLVIYLGLSISYGLLWFTGIDIMDSDFGILFLTIVPMSIAGYFIFVTHDIQKSINHNPINETKKIEL